MAATNREMQRLIGLAFAPTTHLAYDQGVRVFLQFCTDHSIPHNWPFTSLTIAHFVAFMSITGKSVSTVRTYLAGIGASHKIHGWSDPTNSFLVSKLLKGLARDSKTQDTRCPITLVRLKLMVNCLPVICTSHFEAVLSCIYLGIFRVPKGERVAWTSPQCRCKRWP